MPRITKQPDKKLASKTTKEIKSLMVIKEEDRGLVKSRLRFGNVMYSIVMAICTVLVAIGIGIELWYWADTAASSKKLQTLSSEYAGPSETVIDEVVKDTSALPPIVDFEGLRTVNPDVSSWLRIPGTTVDYPVVSSDEKDKYLYRDFDGNDSISGSLFTDHQNTADLSQQHIVIYGHHMNAAVMFHDVANYTDGEFFEGHRKMYLTTPDTVYVLRAVGSYIADGGEYMARQVLFGNENDFQSYLDERLARCDYVKEQDSERRVLDKLVTLVTCTNSGDARVVVECVVEEEYPAEYVQNVINNS